MYICIIYIAVILNTTMKYTNSKSYFFSYKVLFEDNNVCLNLIKREAMYLGRELEYAIVGSAGDKTFCFIKFNKRIQTRNRYFLSLYYDGKENIPVFYPCSKKKKVIDYIVSKNNIVKFNTNEDLN